jgi:limonene-1,2-epoxide hydrolase
MDAKVVGDFLDAWHTHDVDRIMSFVSEDCHYENVPSLTGENPVLKGRAAMRTFLAPFFAEDPLTVPFKFHTEIRMTVAGDGAVASQRVDHFEIGNGRFALPVAGFF